MPELTAGGLRIHYVAAPARPRDPVIVFLHGAGANHTVWLAQVKALRVRAWVVLPDLPGHGRSQAIPGLAIEEYAEAIVPFLEAVRSAAPTEPMARTRAAPSGGSGADPAPAASGDTSAARAAASRQTEASGPRSAPMQPGGPPERGAALVLAGHSMGAAIALTIALSRPSLLAGLVLVGAGAKLSVSSEILDGLASAPRETQGLIARWQFAKGADPELIVRTMKDLAGTSAERVLADFRACDAFDVRERLGEIRIPALVLCGGEDKMTRPSSSEFLTEHLPAAHLVLIERAGHAVMVERPEAVSGAIAGFLDSLPVS